MPNDKHETVVLRPTSTRPDSLVEAASQLALFESGTDPRAIVAAVFRRPFIVDRTLGPDELALLTNTIRHSPTGAILDVDLAEVGGLAVVNKVTPEQLLAIVASIIATAPDATQACVRIKQETEGWRFE